MHGSVPGTVNVSIIAGVPGIVDLASLYATQISEHARDASYCRIMSHLEGEDILSWRLAIQHLPRLLFQLVHCCLPGATGCLQQHAS